jgi:hypothetical protein
MYVYISENEKFTEYDDPAALFWLEEDLVYGDWTAGKDDDGSLTHTGTIPLSEVDTIILKLSIHCSYGFFPSLECAKQRIAFSSCLLCEVW